MTFKNYCSAFLWSVVAFAASLMAGAGAAQPAETSTPLLQQPIANMPGKTFTSVVVEFPPSARAAPHRHGDAFVYAYVLAGKVRSQIDDEPPRTFQVGESWFERPGAHHRLTENTSPSEPAKLLVVFVGSAGQPLKTTDQP